MMVETSTLAKCTCISIGTMQNNEQTCRFKLKFSNNLPDGGCCCCGGGGGDGDRGGSGGGSS